MATPRQVHVKITDDRARSYYDALRPKRHGDSGIDLYFIDTCVIPAGETKKIKLGIAIQPADADDLHGFLMFPRSSICKTPLRLSNSVGVIDSGYTGEICAYFDNIKKDSYTIKPGQALLQICSFNGDPLSMRVLDNNEQLRSTDRGQGGFGSTTE